VADLITQTFQDLVAGTNTGVDGILANMARMALGIVRQVAVAIAAYEAQAIAMAILKGGTFDFVGAGIAFAAAAAVAGIAAGLESRLSASSSPVTAPTSTTPTDTSTNSSTANNVVDIPNSAVTVIASPSWVADMGVYVDRMGAYINRLVTEGIYVHMDQSSSGSTGSSLGWDLGDSM